MSAKAGFIEDADELHLATKPMYAAVIRAWAASDDVKTEFASSAPGGRQRLQDIVDVVEYVFRAENARYAKLHAKWEKQKPLKP